MPKAASEVMKSMLVEFLRKRMKQKITDSGFSDCDSDRIAKTSSVDSKMLSKKISMLVDFQGKRMKWKTTDSGFSDCESDRVEKATSVDSRLLFEKTLRALMIKTRFAETILKAQDKMIMLKGGNKATKERLVKKKAEIRSKVEIERKMLREKEREGARIALEKMEKLVKWNDTIQVEMEFKKLIGVHKFPVR